MSYLRYIDLNEISFKEMELICDVFIHCDTLRTFSQVLEENELLCTDLYQVNTDGVILTKQSV